MVRQKIRREQIVDGARKAFLANGYDETNTDMMAASAGVSKATMYAHFRSKEDLFLAVMKGECERQIDVAMDIDCASGPAQDAVFRLAYNVITLLSTPQVLDMYRMAVSGSRRFPAFGETFYSAGPEFGMRSIASCFTLLRQRGLLDVSDPLTAARQFGQLCKSDRFYRALFHVDQSPDPVEIEKEAQMVARTFLRAFSRVGAETGHQRDSRDAQRS